MIHTILEGLIAQWEAEFLTEIFFWILTGIFIFGIVIFLLGALEPTKYKRNTEFVRYVPILLTSVGILGTFLGIVVGLGRFNENDIDGSITDLLSGLETAFFTSLLGMMGSILFKVFTALFTFFLTVAKPTETDLGELTIDDLFLQSKEQTQELQAITASIGGDDGSSLVSQLKLVRSGLDSNHKLSTQYLNEFQDKLWINLQNFSDMMSKSATEQVVSALQKAISDFNQNLTEQFGENFKELNKAVSLLVTWQENYKQQLTQMSDQYQLGVNAIAKTEASVQTISEESKAIPKSMEELQGVIKLNQAQMEGLNRHLEAFADVRDRAVEAIPEIRKQIDTTLGGVESASKTLTDGIKNGSEIVQDSLTKTNTVLRSFIEELKTDANALHESFQKATKDLVTSNNELREQFSKNIASITENLRNSISDIAETHSSETKKMLTGLTQNSEVALQDVGQSVTKQVQLIDDALEHELNRVMSEMGSALGTISNQFTNDYTKLVAAMRKVTSAAND